MNRRYYCLFVVLLFIIIFNRVIAAENTYKILFIQSYTSQTPWHADLTSGLAKGFKDSGLKVEITTEYLDADFWTFNSEKVIMRRFCQRARERRTDLIITSSDEAFYTLFSCGDSLPMQLPVVFFGIKYPDDRLISNYPNVCGYTSNPDFAVMLRQAKKIFPQRKDVVCVIDNSFLSNKGREDFKDEWEIFHQENPDYKMKIYNTQQETTNHIIAAICYPRNSYNSVVIAPKWSPFLSFVGKNSKAPVFSCQNVGLTNGVFVAYDTDAFASAHLAAQRASQVLQGTSPSALGISKLDQEFIYDYRQLEYFHVNQSRIPAGGIIVNQPYWEKYKFLFILFYSSILVLLIGSVVWLVRVNRRESKRRIHAQTRLLVQNKMVEQRNEFDNIFHSIRDGVITYDINLNIHFTNRSLLKMLHLPYDTPARPYEGMPAGSIFKIFYNGEEILRDMLNEVATTGNRVVIPKGAFMKEVHSENYFPVSGEIVPIHSKGQITGMALSARNVSDEEMQKRFFDMALEESFIYPWQFDVAINSFIFPQGFLVHFGYDESITTISRDEMDQMIHPDDLVEMSRIFDKALTGDESCARLNFRQRNATGEYEWWEYRSSVITGLTSDSLYNILGVCQSIQRYKTAEQEMREARDKALQADKLKSAFLANMSHEIRTPLNAIVGFSDLLSDTSAFTVEEVAQFIATINKNCGLLLALINDILDLSRIESGTMEFQFASHNLSLLLKTVHDSQRLNMPQGVELVLCVPEGDKKYLVTDNVRLQQVINNLINNAAKFTTSGFITFGYEDDKDPNYTLLFVEDTGVGITQEGIEHIFERFYKVDNFTQGAGLGLSICQTIVERLRGTISVSSEVGKGTRFTVRVPNSCE
ncbi:ABC transporter substrate binding protein [Bacteroides faecichinchillae]|uniref:histidine kinase n=1 Tax=Bacteroides faecichinchillae TaxID=871325 RepID=A0A1M4XVQ0_9BACE|nr:ABC transporter substrate binding protein [Bacteroides faecichinchillae]THG69139.1 two-component sensor histidine kinase [Bacteroides faecichinchillae]SHE97498.1 Signal transduction histidine kinase [Bacteroides faecichinchillae]